MCWAAIIEWMHAYPLANNNNNKSDFSGRFRSYDSVLTISGVIIQDDSRANRTM